MGNSKSKKSQSSKAEKISKDTSTILPRELRVIQSTSALLHRVSSTPAMSNYHVAEPCKTDDDVIDQRTSSDDYHFTRVFKRSAHPGFSHRPGVERKNEIRSQLGSQPDLSKVKRLDQTSSELTGTLAPEKKTVARKNELVQSCASQQLSNHKQTISPNSTNHSSNLEPEQPSSIPSQIGTTQEQTNFFIYRIKKGSPTRLVQEVDITLPDLETCLRKYNQRVVCVLCNTKDMPPPNILGQHLKGKKHISNGKGIAVHVLICEVCSKIYIATYSFVMNHPSDCSHLTEPVLSRSAAYNEIDFEKVKIKIFKLNQRSLDEHCLSESIPRSYEIFCLEVNALFNKSWLSQTSKKCQVENLQEFKLACLKCSGSHPLTFYYHEFVKHLNCTSHKSKDEEQCFIVCPPCKLFASISGPEQVKLHVTLPNHGKDLRKAAKIQIRHFSKLLFLAPGASSPQQFEIPSIAANDIKEYMSLIYTGIMETTFLKDPTTYCYLCQTETSNAIDFPLHYTSPAHQFSMSNSFKSIFACGICNVIYFFVEEATVFQYHTSGKDHKGRESTELLKSNEPLPEQPASITVPPSEKTTRTVKQNTNFGPTSTVPDLKPALKEIKRTNKLLQIKMRLIREDLQRQLKHKFPSAAFYFFGSSVNGIGSVDTPVDIYVETGSTSPHHSDVSAKDILRILNSSHSLFRHVELPELGHFCYTAKVKHASTETSCHIFFGDRLPLEMSWLMKAYIDLDSRVATCLIYVRQWAKRISPNLDAIPNYCLDWLVIFHLMQPCCHLLPPPELFHVCRKENTTAASDCPVKIEASTIKRYFDPVETCKKSSAEILNSFFAYYSEVPFQNIAFNLLSGQEVPRYKFENRNALNALADPNLHSSSNLWSIDFKAPVICIDPFLRSFNILQNVRQKDLVSFQKSCQIFRFTS